jgi:hypothetical protein
MAQNMADTAMDRREKIIELFAAACSRDDRVAAAFVGGSFATGGVDEFSDLDLYAIIQAKDYEQFLAGHVDFFDQFSNPVFLEHFDGFGFDMYVFIFEDGTQGELALARPDRFSHIHGGPFRVLIDRNGLLEGAEFPWQRPSESQQKDELEKHLKWFWRDLSLFLVAIGRDQIWTAAGYLESMRLRCINLARIDHDFSAWADGYEKLDVVIHDSKLAMVKESFQSLKRSSIISAAESLISFYQHKAPATARKHDVAYPFEVEQVVMREFSKLFK